MIMRFTLQSINPSHRGNPTLVTDVSQQQIKKIKRGVQRLERLQGRRWHLYLCCRDAIVRREKEVLERQKSGGDTRLLELKVKRLRTALAVHNPGADPEEI